MTTGQSDMLLCGSGLNKLLVLPRLTIRHVMGAHLISMQSENGHAREVIWFIKGSD
jgi:hypothetical protein